MLNGICNKFKKWFFIKSYKNGVKLDTLSNLLSDFIDETLFVILDIEKRDSIINKILYTEKKLIKFD